MRVCVQLGSALIVLGGMVIDASNAPAITVELARKCQALTDKAYPPRMPGNPAAGSAAGSGRQMTDYYNKCVAANGNVPEPASNAPSK